MKLFATTLFFLISLSAFSKSAEVDTTIKGVLVSFNYSTDIFPESWREAPINAVAEQIDGTEIQRSKKVTVKALNKYPLAVFKRELKSIYYLKSIKFYDVGFGGTNSTDALYLSSNGKSLGYTDFYLEKSFHHEFSSILYRNHPEYIDETEWKKANIEGFDYNDPEAGVGAIRNNKSSEEIDTALCQKGFLTQYSLSGMENDINTFAQNIFIPAKGFWEAVERYPGIRKKLQLIIDFYNKIDPVFTEAYFKKFK